MSYTSGSQEAFLAVFRNSPWQRPGLYIYGAKDQTWVSSIKDLTHLFLWPHLGILNIQTECLGHLPQSTSTTCTEIFHRVQAALLLSRLQGS